MIKQTKSLKVTQETHDRIKIAAIREHKTIEQYLADTVNPDGEIYE